jgi:hypothetical protein
VVTYAVEVRLFPVPHPTKMTNNGSPVMIPVTVRKLLLTTTTEVVGPKVYRAVRTVRRGVVAYTISAKVEPKHHLWPLPTLRPDPEPRWKRLETLSESSFLAWLSHRVSNAQTALQTLLSTPARRNHPGGKVS